MRIDDEKKKKDRWKTQDVGRPFEDFYQSIQAQA